MWNHHEPTRELFLTFFKEVAEHQLPATFPFFTPLPTKRKFNALLRSAQKAYDAHVTPHQRNTSIRRAVIRSGDVPVYEEVPELATFHTNLLNFGRMNAISTLEPSHVLELFLREQVSEDTGTIGATILDRLLGARRAILLQRLQDARREGILS